MFIVTVTGATGSIWNGLLARRRDIETEIRMMFNRNPPERAKEHEFQFHFVAMSEDTTNALRPRDMHAHIIISSLTPHEVWADHLRDRLLPYLRGVTFSVTMLEKYKGKPLNGHAVHHPSCLPD